MVKKLAYPEQNLYSIKFFHNPGNPMNSSSKIFFIQDREHWITVLYEEKSKNIVAFGVSYRNPIDAPNNRTGKVISYRRALKYIASGKERENFYGSFQNIPVFIKKTIKIPVLV